MSAIGRVVLYGRMIKFSHSIFALPFALASVVLAAGRELPWNRVGWIVVAMVAARSAAMGFNRLADHALDAQNPRTAQRELPRGALRRGEVWLFVILSAVLLVWAAARLNPLCLRLSPLALVIVFVYSFTKRWTALSHLALGAALAIAPIGAWLAITGRFAAAPIVLALAVLAWVGGFDTIYACQDVEFDRRAGLHSLPAHVGIARALWAARALHTLGVFCLGGLFWLAPLHAVYWLGVAAVAALLVYEHSLVRADDLTRVDAAFFTVNGWISIAYLVVTALARWMA